ncbi:MAG: prefoldin subunit beta [Archaeoglobaceae archaeon]
MKDLPPDAQNMLSQLQQLQQQLQSVMNQKRQAEAYQQEAEEALEEVQNVGGEVPMYKATGNVLVKAEKDKLVSELEEKKETYGLRVKTLERQENKLREKLEELQNKLQSMFSSGSEQSGTGE